MHLKKNGPYDSEATVKDVGNCPTQMNKNPGLILNLHPPNERRRYKVTPSVIGWAQT